MILHVAGLDKFLPPFVELINKEFNQNDHEFWLNDNKGAFSVREYSTVEVVRRGGVRAKFKAYLSLAGKIRKADKVILHGLFNRNVVLLLALRPWLLKKCYWVIWGGDLYCYRLKRKKLLSNLYEVLRRFVIRRLGHLVTYIDGDIELARKWYGAEGEYHRCLMYLSNVVDPSVIAHSPNGQKPSSGIVNILLGNSADPSNNHIEALERLLPYRDQNIRIYAPLSYGDEEHARIVARQGQEWFGEKFVPMMEFMQFGQYLEFLKGLDIVIFNHKRQQAMGNSITLLAMGKPVFMRTDVSHWKYLTSLGIKIHDVNQLSLQISDDDLDRENIRIVYDQFSRENLMRQLSELFEVN